MEIGEGAFVCGASATRLLLELLERTRALVDIVSSREIVAGVLLIQSPVAVLWTSVWLVAVAPQSLVGSMHTGEVVAIPNKERALTRVSRCLARF